MEKNGLEGESKEMFIKLAKGEIDFAFVVA